MTFFSISSSSTRHPLSSDHRWYSKMRFLLPLVLFGVAASAESVEEVVNSMPACASSCVRSFFTSVGCSVENPSCMCDVDDSELASAGADVGPCVQSDCGTDELADWFEDRGVTHIDLANLTGTPICDGSSSDDSSDSNSETTQDDAANILTASSAILLSGAVAILVAW
ncbi:uncharacterized protein BJX67DRAFT_347714 [Aspergillus lucknowensis]|uniref:CFEM domain-containing protein n=1 Tax=Aspergillus lucknowensis TaxID=176173 RepID=A0ABR4LZL4_9EURO